MRVGSGGECGGEKCGCGSVAVGSVAVGSAAVESVAIGSVAVGSTVVGSEYGIGGNERSVLRWWDNLLTGGKPYRRNEALKRCLRDGRYGGVIFTHTLSLSLSLTLSLTQTHTDKYRHTPTHARTLSFSFSKMGVMASQIYYSWIFIGYFLGRGESDH